MAHLAFCLTALLFCLIRHLLFALSTDLLFNFHSKDTERNVERKIQECVRIFTFVFTLLSCCLVTH